MLAAFSPRRRGHIPSSRRARHPPDGYSPGRELDLPLLHLVLVLSLFRCESWKWKRSWGS